ncbi:MAG: fructosamine kinase family protein [Gammaproteobacteria bacterium]|nr:fructosamine kinase family protein [Gammaproteobacteria bacterium]
MTDWNHIADHIGATTDRDFEISSRHPRGGGSINSAWEVAGGGERYFVKLNDAERIDMFEAEGEGLAELARAGTIRVPKPICWGLAGSESYIVMEYLPLSPSSGDTQTRLGEQLAAMHRFGRDRFGWHRDNTIGSTPQPNTQESGWVTFWRKHRLGHQLKLANAHFGNGLQRTGERLLDALPALFSDYRPSPSLLHGDLWGGNASADADGNPVIFDPATYYGDREADLAMTELFGGFSRSFYDAYTAAWPLDPGYRTRKVLYNVYHLLNHANMFGGGYASQAQHGMEKVLAEIGT